MISIPKKLASFITLSNGVKMPMFGIGTGKNLDQDCEPIFEKPVIFALQNGCRMIDTAEMYRNESEIGRAIKLSGIIREDIFIITKTWNNGQEQCLTAFNNSLKMLDVSYIDLYLIHKPVGGKILETYDTMLELQKQGLIRSVGVANMGIQHLKGIAEAGRPLPAVNQIELHPWQRKDQLVKYCRDNKIVVMASSPLTKGQHLDNPELVTVAKRYNKTPAQVLVRWCVQQGYVTIPKSVKTEHIIQNVQVFDFELTEEDMNTLNSFPSEPLKRPYEWMPTELPWEG